MHLQWHAIFTPAIFLALASTALAQQAGPRIGYVYPAGGQRGTKFQVTIGGQGLAGAGKVYVSGEGVQCKVLQHIRPLAQKELNDLREELTKLRQKGRALWTAADEKRAAEILKKLATFVRRPNPAIGETVIAEITLSPDAESGPRELRVQATSGLSNPRVFHVGRLPEHTEEAKKLPPENLAQLVRLGYQPPAKANTPPIITLPSVVNGQIMPGAVDRYRFAARKGQRLVIAADAHHLIPYLADAVPGWFQAALVLYDAKGKEVAYNDDFRFDPDPVICYEVPVDGEFTVEIKDAIYRGREDFVYRITIGELPLVTSIFPLGGRAGEKTEVALTGWNLPAAGVTVDNSDRPAGIWPLSVSNGKQVSNVVRFMADTLPECMEKEPNDTPATAQPVTRPIIVNGRVDCPGDTDVFRFEGKAGQRIVAEVYSRRLNSPLDSVLRLTDAAGKQLAFNDDYEDKSFGLVTHHADSWLAATLPGDGQYCLHLGDAQHKGGPEYGYRLRISPPRPDFALRLTPSSINARAGGTVPLTVTVIRQDEFAGEITLALKDAPPGFALSGARIPAGQDQAKITLTVPRTPEEKPVNLAIEGQAMIQGQQVVRPAEPAENMIQAFEYRHLVPAQEFKVVVLERVAPRLTVLTAAPLKIPAGGTARVQIAVPKWLGPDKLQLSLSPPPGITMAGVSPIAAGLEIVVAADAAKVKPGQKGNLIVAVSAKRAPKQPKPKKADRLVPVATVPAIAFEIVAP